MNRFKKYMSMNRKRWLLFSSVLVITLLLLADVFVTLQNNSSIEKSQQIQQRAEKFLQEESNYPLLVLHNLDLGLRGYVVTDKNSNLFLQPLNLAIRDKDSLFSIMEKSLAEVNFPMGEFYAIRDTMESYAEYCLHLKHLYDTHDVRFQIEFSQDRGYGIWRVLQKFSKRSKAFVSELTRHAQQEYQSALNKNYAIKVWILLLGLPTLLYTLYQTNKSYGLSERLTAMENERSAFLESTNSQLQKKLKERITHISSQNQRLFIQQEEIRKKNEELKDSNQLKNQMIAILSHDLRGPITSLKGILHLMRESLVSPDEIEELSFHFDEKIMTTLSLLDNMLYWVMNQMDGEKSHAEVFDLHDVIDQNLSLLQQQATRKKIAFVSAVPRLFLIRSDKHILDIIMRNLLSNAIKYSHHHGCVRITATSNQEFIRVTVSDHGIGMSVENQQKIFNLFCRFTTEGTNKEKGSGLGLAICSYLANRIKGSLQVESELEKGSSFILTVPTMN